MTNNGLEDEKLTRDLLVYRTNDLSAYAMHTYVSADHAIVLIMSSSYANINNNRSAKHCFHVSDLLCINVINKNSKEDVT